MELSRRSFLSGLGLLFAAPALVRFQSLMSVKKVPFVSPIIRPTGMVFPLAGDIPEGFLPCDGRLLLRSKYPKLFSAIAEDHSMNFINRPPDDRAFFEIPDAKYMMAKPRDNMQFVIAV
jgi:hypothetical protein